RKRVSFPAYSLADEEKKVRKTACRRGVLGCRQALLSLAERCGLDMQAAGNYDGVHVYDTPGIFA
ncbi:MAG TPA: hypothetical protein VKX41_04965, partial [Alloacidobacterium sp.]|nr:hypothetical protein [Alloacidobacterium sp.]